MKNITQKMFNLKDENMVIKSERIDIEDKLANFVKLKSVEMKEYEHKILLFNNLLTKERTVSNT